MNEAEVVGTPGSGFGKNGEGFFRLTAFGTLEKTQEAWSASKSCLKSNSNEAKGTVQNLRSLFFALDLCQTSCYNETELIPTEDTLCITKRSRRFKAAAWLEQLGIATAPPSMKYSFWAMRVIWQST